MKILYLCPDAGIPVQGRKGASVHVRQMIAAFERAGHAVILAAPALTKSPWERPALLAAPVIHCRASAATQEAVQAVKEYLAGLGAEPSISADLRRMLGAGEMAAELRQRLRRDRPDFIYERASLFSTVGLTLAREWRVPLIVELNAPLVEEQATYRSSGLGELAARAERQLLSGADMVFTVSAPLRDHAITCGADPGRTRVLPNGVDAVRFRPGPPGEGLRSRMGLTEGPVIGFLGGLRPWHGIEILPALLARLSATHPEVQLLIAGDGPLRGILERGLAERGLLGRTVFAGNLDHDEVPDILRLFDIALAPYPPLEHDFYFSPLKLFEYMACGVAVVAADCGQISELVRDGENGLLHPPGDLEALSAACLRLLDDPELRRNLGTAAARMIRSGYTWDHNADRVTACLRDAATSLRAGRILADEPVSL